MSKYFGNWLKQYNNYSKGDRNAIIILGIIILILAVGIVIAKNFQPKSKFNHTQYEQLLKDLESPEINHHAAEKTLFVFNPNTITPEKLDSLDFPDFVKRNILNYRNAGGRFYSTMDVRKIYGMTDSIFLEIENYIRITENTHASIKTSNIENRVEGFIDLNQADIKQFSEFGFSRFQARNIIGYREKGGIFKAKTDLLKIYGIDSTFYHSIEKYIQIETFETTPVVSNKPEILQIELNSADSVNLLKLKGIGSVYATRIIKYRNLLGGFYSTSQLLEVYNFPEETFKTIEKSISVDTLLIKKIRINFAEFPDLLRHPYLNKKQVEAILNFRNKNGPFQDLIQLKSNGLIDNETFLKINPYFTCR